MPAMISTTTKKQSASSIIKKTSSQFILQLHKQFEIPVEEIEKAIVQFGVNRKALEKYMEQKIVHELQWKSFAWQSLLAHSPGTTETPVYPS